MAVDKVLNLASGGTLILSLERVNVFTLTENERELLSGITDAVKKFETKESPLKRVTENKESGT